jgi:uncharacterized metal-binding protein
MQKSYSPLYTKEDRKVMKTAEDSLHPKVDRIDEIEYFARETGINRVGIANCITFEKEAEKLEKHLLEKGFEVVRANCKLGRMPFDEILPGYKGVSCNPVGQAAVLNEANTELNLVMGLCIGHDMLFNAKSKALTTTLVVKDRKYSHQTLKRLNNL